MTNPKLKELAEHLGRLSDFFESNRANSPIAIVLDDQASKDFMRSISEPWKDIHWVQKSLRFMGMELRFEPAKIFPAPARGTEYYLKEHVREIHERAAAEARPYLEELMRIEHLKPPPPIIIDGKTI